MAWPTSGTNGWETFGTVITTEPIRYDLPVPLKGYYYDPARLRGVGNIQTAITLVFNYSTIVVRRRVSTIEAEFITSRIWGDALLDQVVVPELGEPCTIVADIYGDDREEILWSVGTSPGHAHPFLLEPESYAEQEIDAANGAATVGTITLSIIDRRQTAGDQDTGWVTAKLAELGLANLAGRRVRVRRFISEELGWVVLADGPAGAPRLDQYAAFTFDVRDTRDTERTVQIFQGGGGITPVDPESALDPTGAKTLLPDGVYGGYGFDPEEATFLIDPASPLLGRWSLGFPDLNGDTTALVNLQSDPGNAADALVVSIPAYQAMEGTSVTEGERQSLGGDDWQRPYRVRFANLSLLWRAAGSGDPWTEINSGNLVIDGMESDVGGTVTYKHTNLTLANPYPTPEAETGRSVTSVFVGDLRGTGFTPVDDQAIELIVVYRGPPTKDLPVYVEGLTAGEFARNVYAGVYSARDEEGNLVPTGIQYDEDALLLMTDLVRFRLFEAISDARDWLELHIYAPTGWIPALDDLGRISPVSQVSPESVDGLTGITDAITEPSSNWNAGDRIINVIRFLYDRDYRPSNPANADTADGLAARPIVVEFEDTPSIARHGRKVLTIEADAFTAIGNPAADPVSGTLFDEQGYQLAALRQLHVQNRYSLGAPSIQVAVMRLATLSLRAGSWVAVDLSWLPDYLTQKRGLVGMAQVVALGDLDCRWRQLTMEMVIPLVVPDS